MQNKLKKFKQGVKFIFGAGMWINAVAMLPQSIALYQTHETGNVNLYTFSTFFFLQVNGIFYAKMIAKDRVLMIGLLLSAIVTGSIVTQILIY